MSVLTVDDIFRLFKASVDPNPQVRETGEQRLQQISTIPGFAPLLLQILSKRDESSLDQGIYQACAVYFKNFVEKNWESTNSSDARNSFSISQEDKKFIKLSILSALAIASVATRTQLTTCIHRIVRYEFPENWQEVNEQASLFLQSSDLKMITAGLICALEIIKFQSLGSDKSLESTLITFMPHILTIGQRALQALSSTSTEIFFILKSVVKAFYSAIRYKSSKHLFDPQNFTHWCSLIMALIQASVPQDLKPKDVDDAYELDKNLYWKMKKWAFRCQNRVFSKYGSEDGKSSSSFSKMYLNNFAVTILQVNLHVIQNAITMESPVTDCIFNLLNDYLTDCVRVKKTWKLVKPHVVDIITHFVFPRICFSETDMELWKEDPQEYLKTIFFSFDDYDSTVSSCINLIVDIVKSRKKDVFMPVLSFINNILEKYANNPESFELQRQKDGAIFLIGSLSKVLLSSELKKDMQAFLSAHVVPDLSSPQPFLRMRACWCIEQFDELIWGSVEHASALFNGIMNCLNDSELPVKAQAAVTIGSLLDQEFVEKNIIPYLGKVVQTVLDLTNQVELDSLSYVMERLLNMYPTELSPFAVELGVQMGESLIRMLEGGISYTDDNICIFNDTDKMMAAIALTEAIDSVIISMCSNRETAIRMEKVIIPIVIFILQKRITDLYSEAFSLIESLTFRAKEISVDMWGVFGQMIQSYQTDAREFFPDMSTSFENYISYGSAVLLQNPQYLNNLLVIINNAMEVSDEEYDSEADKLSGIDLMETMMLYCRGSIDSLIPNFIDLVMKAFTLDQTEELTSVSLIRHLEIILNAMYYNPLITVNHLEGRSQLQPFLMAFTNNIGKFSRVHDKRLIMAALASVFHIPIASMPNDLKNLLPTLFSVMIDAVQSYPKVLEEREKIRKEQEGEAEGGEIGSSEPVTDPKIYGEIEDSGEEEEGDGEFIDSSQVDGDDDELLFEDGDDDDWEDVDELEEDLYFECPLDQVDFNNLIKKTIHDTASNRPQNWAMMTCSLNPEQVNFLQSF